MERLTKLDGIGQGDLIACFECNATKAGSMNEHCGMCERFVEMANRLMEYEDTGLTPEQIAEINTFTGSQLEQMLTKIRALELELDQYKQAEADGVLVRLPCKVGDVVFTICWNIKNQKYEVCTGKVKNVRCDSMDGSVMVSDGEYYRVWGETVFLTQEEAEKALKGREQK